MPGFTTDFQVSLENLNLNIQVRSRKSCQPAGKLKILEEKLEVFFVCFSSYMSYTSLALPEDKKLTTHSHF